MTSYEVAMNDGYCTLCGAHMNDTSQCPSCGSITEDLTITCPTCLRKHNREGGDCFLHSYETESSCPAFEDPTILGKCYNYAEVPEWEIPF